MNMDFKIVLIVKDIALLTSKLQYKIFFSLNVDLTFFCFWKVKNGEHVVNKLWFNILIASF